MLLRSLILCNALASAEISVPSKPFVSKMTRNLKPEVHEEIFEKVSSPN